MNAAQAFKYRAVRNDGSTVVGEISALDNADALARIRLTGATPIEIKPLGRQITAQPTRTARNNAISRALIGELGVLLKAGLSLDRALALAIGNIEDPAAAEAMGALLRAVREGASLSRAMLENPGLFTPGEAAMAEAGEANGKLGEAMERLAVMLEQAAELRRIVITSMIYPCALLVISVGVILMMLLLVVPQFERLLDSTHGQLPAASMAVIGASQILRAYGLYMLLALVALGFAARQALARPETRQKLDRLILAIPLLGEITRRIETARLAHTLGALVEGGVALPTALLLAQRTIGNSVMSAAIGKVAEGLREGGGLTAPLAAANILPRIAIGFLRTGEETSQLGLMLGRLALVLDRDVRNRLEQFVALLTPAITVTLGAAVAGIIAAIMSAILGFNDLAVSQ